MNQSQIFIREMNVLSKVAVKILIIAFCALAVTACASTRPQTGSAERRVDFTKVTPLAHAHAHNDYLHQHPLFDALSEGFSSIEADVWLINGRLLVAHDRIATKPDRTLESLYLDRLKRIVAAGGGGVYGPGTHIVLLVDVKSEADSTYHELERELFRYREMLTSYNGDKEEPGAVTVIVSGNRDFSLMAGETFRLAAYDGRLADLNSNAAATLIPLISADWKLNVGWNGTGAIPGAQRAGLDAIVAAAHAKGRAVRFWATPDRPGAARTNLWKTLLVAGVDYLNTDDLPGLRSFLLGSSRCVTPDR